MASSTNFWGEKYIDSRVLCSVSFSGWPSRRYTCLLNNFCHHLNFFNAKKCMNWTETYEWKVVLFERIWCATDAFSSVPLPYATSEGFVTTRLSSHVLFILLDFPYMLIFLELGRNFTVNLNVAFSTTYNYFKKVSETVRSSSQLVNAWHLKFQESPKNMHANHDPFCLSLDQYAASGPICRYHVFFCCWSS